MPKLDTCWCISDICVNSHKSTIFIFTIYNLPFFFFWDNTTCFLINGSPSVFSAIYKSVNENIVFIRKPLQRGEDWRTRPNRRNFGCIGLGLFWEFFFDWWGVTWLPFSYLYLPNFLFLISVFKWLIIIFFRIQLIIISDDVKHDDIC